LDGALDREREFTFVLGPQPCTTRFIITGFQFCFKFVPPKTLNIQDLLKAYTEAFKLSSYFSYLLIRLRAKNEKVA
jgi:hypothetical protein